MSMNQITVTARTPMSQSTARNKLELVPRPRNDQRAVSPIALFLASLTSMFPPPPPPPPFPPLLFLFFYLSTGSGFLARCLFEKGGDLDFEILSNDIQMDRNRRTYTCGENKV